MATPNRRPRDLLVRCAALACVAALPVAFNAWIDPARLRPWPDDERAIAQALLAGHNVTDVTNFNAYAIERLLADGRAHAPEVLAIGASRIQMLPASAFPGRRFVNAAVAGASLDDMLSVYALYDTAAGRPRRVVLNLDPGSTDRDLDTPGWTPLLAGHASMLRKLGDSAPPWRFWLTKRVSTLKRMATPEYFRLSVYSWRTYGPSGARFVVTDREQNDNHTKTPDGTLVWPREPPEQTERAATDYVALMRRGRAPYNGVDKAIPERARLLEQFVRYLRRDGIEVDLLLVPFHPLVYGEFARRPRNSLADVESRYRDLARRTGASIVGSYDPVNVDAAAADFFDDAHLRPDALVRLFRR